MIHSTLAEAAPSFTPGELAAFLGIVAFLLGLYVLGKKAFGHEPPLHKEYAPRTEIEKLEKKIDAGIAKDTSARKGIYGTLDAHSARLAALEADKHTTAEKLGTLDDKIAENTAITSDTKAKMEGVAAKTDLTHAQVQLIDGKIERILREMPRNT
ncbi:MAG: hypothetical protein HZA93_13205 [Verrucomicrobia bacterium]|nr:hypothetical protein [Verrucomicrobiota bacterium]